MLLTEVAVCPRGEAWATASIMREERFQCSCCDWCRLTEICEWSPSVVSEVEAV